MTVTASLNAAEYRATVTVTGLPVAPTPPAPWPATPWTLFRTDGVTEFPVRGGFDRDLDANAAAVLYDHEYPLSRPFAYVLRYIDAVTGPVVVFSDWINPPDNTMGRVSDPVTGEGVNCTIVSWPEWARDARSTVYDVEGRVDPFIVNARMGSPSSQLLLRTLVAGDWRTLERLIITGRTLLVRASHTGVDDAYLVPSRYALQRITGSGTDARRHHLMDTVQTQMPDPSIIGSGSTLQDLHNAFPGTLQDIANAFDFLYEIAAADL